MSFRVELETFRGPLDLLLYLVRKHEVDITDLPIAMIADQFLQHMTVLEQIDVDAVGDFLEMASTLIEIKSRMVLPRGGEETEEPEDPREDLVQRLLEYKKFKDAAGMLEEQSVDWQQRYARVSNDLPPRRVELSEQPIQDVESWDLVSAFGRVMRDQQSVQPSNIVYDDTPIHVYMARIRQRLLDQQRVAFSEMFSPGMHKSAMIGVFLAILELVRHHNARTDQSEMHGEIWIIPGESLSEDEDVPEVDDYDNKPSEPAEAEQ